MGTRPSDSVFSIARVMPVRVSKRAGRGSLLKPTEKFMALLMTHDAAPGALTSLRCRRRMREASLDLNPGVKTRQ